jgi:hypothetical protein
MQVAVCVGKRFWFSMTFTGRSQSLVGNQQEKLNPLSIVSAAMGYTIPESGQTVLLIAHQSIFSPSLNHNLLSTMQMILHDVIVNETPKFQSLNPTKLSHSISVRGDNVEDVLLIPLELHGVVSCFPTFKPTQLEFETCDRYELNYESPEYDPSATTFHDQEAGMMDS